MQHRSLKLAVGLVTITAAMSMLGYAGVQRGWVYSVEVDSYLDQPHLHTQRVRVNGVVAKDGMQVQPAHLVARFDLVSGDARMPVVYRGVVPSMFHGGVEAVVEGQLDEAGVFQADVLMTKCASKYQAEDHANGHYDFSDLPTEPMP